MTPKTQSFKQYLQKENLSDNTISAYQWTISYFLNQYDGISAETLTSYKSYLVEHFKPKTVNLRLQAMNKYLCYLGITDYHLKNIKIQQNTYLENVISNADYLYLIHQLKKEKNLTWYFVVRYLAATGARISELICIKIEHAELGYLVRVSKVEV